VGVIHHRLLKEGARHRSRELRANATEPERKLWFRLREFKKVGFHVRRQAPFGQYVLDFVEHSCRLVIEVDGSQHGEKQHVVRDMVRDRVLASEGYKVLRIPTPELAANFDEVVEFIFHELETRRIFGTPTRSAARSDLPTRGR
jgi:very-short-patch-repair endonuclease